jgi:hypothetical protein
MKKNDLAAEVTTIFEERGLNYAEGTLKGIRRKRWISFSNPFHCLPKIEGLNTSRRFIAIHATTGSTNLMAQGRDTTNSAEVKEYRS